MTDIKNGIYLLFELTGDNKFDVHLDLLNPSESIQESFAVFLSVLESGKILEIVKKEIIDLARNKPELEPILEYILKHKNLVDTTIDMPAILPTDVFHKR